MKQSIPVLQDKADKLEVSDRGHANNLPLATFTLMEPVLPLSIFVLTVVVCLVKIVPMGVIFSKNSVS